MEQDRAGDILLHSAGGLIGPAGELGMGWQRVRT